MRSFETETELPDETTQVATPQGRKRQETEARRRLVFQIAAETLIDPRTINKYLKGEPVTPSVRIAIAQAMKGL
jgi:hypothetical protein